MPYEKFAPQLSAKLIMNYLTNMVDPACDDLPYWLLLPNKKPAEAAHCRVDDAELVASWYEGIDAAGRILGTGEGDDVKAAFRRHLMKSWGEHGLRFHDDYPWTHTNHSSFHEMGYVLSGLDRITQFHPEDSEAEGHAASLIRGLRSLVIERKVRTFWSGDFVETEPIYEFPNDVYLRDGGFDLSRHTGRGEQAIRNWIMLWPLVKRYELTGDQTALDLARGAANYLLGVSRYFNYKMEFFGHVHSAGWISAGLVRLGRVTQEDRYIKAGRGIYEYIRSISSSFGWVPEYAQWHPPEEENCETCCIKDMIQCADELIRVGFTDCWSDMDRYARNQLVENQVRYSGYVVCDNSRPDADGITYHDIDKRMIGGFTGGSLPNSISLTRFRSIAGCCCGTAPVALETVWDNIITDDGHTVTVNIPADKETDFASLTSGYPNEGRVTVKLKRDRDVSFRDTLADGSTVRALVNGRPAECRGKDGLITVTGTKTGDEVAFTRELKTVTKKETVRGTEFTVTWRGNDVVDLSPEGEHVRLYQRDLSKPKYYPSPEDVEYNGAANYGPTQQSRK